MGMSRFATAQSDLRDVGAHIDTLIVTYAIVEKFWRAEPDTSIGLCLLSY